MDWLYRIRLKTKFLILGLIALLMAAVPTMVYFSQAAQRNAVAERELLGTGPVIALLKVVQFIQTHRGMSAGMLGGNQALEARRPGIRDQVNAAIAQVDRVRASVDISPGLNQRWVDIKQTWVALERDVATKAIDTPTSTARHTALITRQIQLTEELMEDFGLTLEPDAAPNALARANFIDLPWLAENLGIMRAMGSGFLARKAAAPESRATLAALHKRASELTVSLHRQIDRVARLDPTRGARFASAVSAQKVAVDQSLGLAQREIIQGAPELTQPVVEYFDTYTRTIDGLYTFSAALSEEMVATLRSELSATHRLQGGLAALFVAGLGLFVWLALAVTRSINTPLAEAVRVTQAIADGDLRVHLQPKGTDELADLLRALQTMRDQLAQVVGRVSTAAESVATASTQIAQGDADLSSRTESAAAALEQTHASMAELGHRVGNNAESAAQANRLAQSASAVAARGGEVMGEVVSTMRDINDSSRRIADIVSLIDGIAFQTNILALNPAVEAARAGEQGRGFAVVAGEVRNLAGRSADAAKEIKSLIDASVTKVEHGSALVDRAGQTMGEVVASIQRVTDIVAAISTSSTEQAQGVAQVVEAVDQMDQGTQQNAALVEEIAAAAASLQSQSQDLVHTVSVFKV